MALLGRSRYNLLQIHAKKDPDMKVEAWEIEDYRALPAETLLASVGGMDLVTFEQLSENYDSPEEWAAELSNHQSEEEKGVLYLSLFELWRRFLTERRAISVICDELDRLITIYQRDPESVDDNIQALVMELSELLDESVDSGRNPRQVFNAVDNHLAYDLETFLYNYSYDQIERGNSTVASEVLEHFQEYLSDSLWFDFLQIRLFQGALPEDVHAMIARFLDRLQDQPDLELYFEVLFYFMQTGRQELFLSAYKEVLSLITTTDELLELLDLLRDFCLLNDFDSESDYLSSLIESHKSQPSGTAISAQDRATLLNSML